MPRNTGSGRNQRNNPYQLEELFIKFHRTPAGIAWRWRTELLVTSTLGAAFWRLDTWTTALWAGIIIGGLAVSVVLTVFIVPAAYLLVYGKKEHTPRPMLA